MVNMSTGKKMSDKRLAVKVHIVSESESDSADDEYCDPVPLSRHNTSSSVHCISDSSSDLEISRKRKRSSSSHCSSDSTVDCSHLGHSDSDDINSDCSVRSNSSTGHLKKKIKRDHVISDSDSESSSRHSTSKQQNPASHGSASFTVKNISGKNCSAADDQHQSILSDSSDSTVDLESVDSSSHISNDHTKGKSDDRPLCRYGSKCYRKNPSHFKQFRHPDIGDVKSSAGNQQCSNEESTSLSGANSASTGDGHASSGICFSSQVKCIGFLLTKVAGIDPTFNQHIAMDIKDILSPSVGNLVKSLQFNYTIDIQWLVEQYPKLFRSKPLLVVHGCQRAEKTAIEKEASSFSHVQLCQAKLDIPYGTHHTKMMILLYEEGLRIIIHTANLVQGDWYQKTQGIWLSPLFPKLPSASSMAGDSVTHFKRDLIQYISAYRARPLEEWIKIIEHHDLSAAKVYLVGSVPGRHTSEKKTAFGHLKLRKVLQSSGPTKLHVQNWPVIGQFSSIGSLGANKENWVCGEWLESLTATRGTSSTLWKNNTRLHLIYPSKENVRLSLEGYLAGGSLPYSINVAKKQPWLHDFFCQWKSEICGRTQASPHIKSYMRISPDWQNIAWFLITSANLSKAAWGALEKNGSQLMIRSYELGVLFLPENFSESRSFYRKKNLHEPSVCLESKQLPFILPFDIPPSPYTEKDCPWIWDIPYVDKPDTHGTKWCPS